MVAGKEVGRAGMGITFKSVNEMVTDRLRESVLGGEFAEGEYLRQQALAQRYGVSEIVVREALRRLEAEGLVEIQRRRGARVSQLSADEVVELYELRVLLEELITRHAVLNCSVSDIEHARAILRASEDERDPVRWLVLNREFHNVLAKPSNRARLLKFADNLRVMMERYLRMSLGILHGFDAGQREHEEILAAYEARDAELAAQRVGAHLRRTADMIASFLRSRESGDRRSHSQGIARRTLGDDPGPRPVPDERRRVETASQEDGLLHPDLRKADGFPS